MAKRLVLFCVSFSVIFGLGGKLQAEVTRLDTDKLIFSKGGGLRHVYDPDSTTGRLETVNNKGLKLTGETAYFEERSPDTYIAQHTIDDYIALNVTLNTEPSTFKTDSSYALVIGNYAGAHIRANETHIQAALNDSNSFLRPDTLYIQDREGPLWIGHTVAETPPFAAVPVQIGSNVDVWVGIGTSRPSSALYVNGDLNLTPVTAGKAAFIGTIGASAATTFESPVSKNWPNDVWREIASVILAPSKMKHGVFLTGNTSLRIADTGGVTRRNGQTRLRIIRQSDNAEIAVSNIATYRFEDSYNERAPFKNVVGAELDADVVYKGVLEAMNSEQTTGAGVSLTAIMMPIETLQSAGYIPPDPPVLDLGDAGSISSLGAGNYLSKNVVSFLSGSSLYAFGDTLYSINSSGEYQPFKAKDIEASAIIQTVSYVYRKSSAGLNDVIIDTNSTDGNRLTFSTSWAGSEEVDSLIQSDSTLRIDSTANMLEDGVVIDEVITINKPKLDPPEPELALDVDGTVTVFGTPRGLMFYSDRQTSVVASGTSSYREFTLTPPEGVKFFVQVYVTVTMSFSSSYVRLNKGTVWLDFPGVTGFDVETTKQFYDFEGGDQNVMQNFMLQTQLEMVGGQSYTLRVHSTINSGTLMSSYTDEGHTWDSNIEVVVFGMPRGE